MAGTVPAPTEPTGRKAHLNPVTGWPLKRGQRLPSWDEKCEASDALLREQPKGHFPHGRRWEISPGRALQWLGHRFAEQRGAASLGALVNDEFGLLLSDLDCYASGASCLPLLDYLRAGREDWGLFAILGRLYVAQQEGEVDLEEFGLEDADAETLARFWQEEEQLRKLEALHGE